eukprot:gene14291-biopygen7256
MMKLPCSVWDLEVKVKRVGGSIAVATLEPAVDELGHSTDGMADIVTFNIDTVVTPKDTDVMLEYPDCRIVDVEESVVFLRRASQYTVPGFAVKVHSQSTQRMGDEPQAYTCHTCPLQDSCTAIPLRTTSIVGRIDGIAVGTLLAPDNVGVGLGRMVGVTVGNAVVGTTEGRLVGRNDGPFVGLEDGTVLGIEVGDVVGLDDGKIVGNKVGIVLGDTDGDIDGSTDGDTLGDIDGDIDGSTDGDTLGDSDGDIDGSTDGDTLGDTDGDIDGSTD